MAQARGLVQCVLMLVGAWLFLAWTFLHSHHDSVVDTACYTVTLFVFGGRERGRERKSWY